MFSNNYRTNARNDPSAQSAAVPEAASHYQGVGNVENDDDNVTGSYQISCVGTGKLQIKQGKL